MRNIVIIFAICILSVISCKAQNTISLEQAAVYPEQPDGRMLPPNTTYLKDINNSLNKYVGMWKGNFNGKTYEFKFIKQINYGSPDGNIRRDRLIGRIRIKDSNGTIIFNNFNEPNDNETFFFGTNFQPNLEAYMVYFVGRSECVEYGNVYLRMLPSTPNQMTVFFHPDNDINVEGSCPTDFQPTIPYQKTIYLTKQ